MTEEVQQQIPENKVKEAQQKENHQEEVQRKDPMGQKEAVQQEIPIDRDEIPKETPIPDFGEDLNAAMDHDPLEKG